MVFFKIAAKNLGRAKSRTFLTVLAIGLGTALLMGITILNESYLDSYITGVSNQLGYTDLGYKQHLNVSDGYFTIDDFMNSTGADKIDGYLNRTGRIVDTHYCTNFPGISDDSAFETTFFGLDLKGDVGFGRAEILNWSESVKTLMSTTPTTIEQILTLNSSYVVITSWVKEVYDFQVGQRILVPVKNDTSTDFDNSSTWKKYEVAAIILDQAEGRDVNFDYSKNKTTSSLKTRAMYFDIGEVRKMINQTANKINLLYLHVQLNKITTVESAIDLKLGGYWFGYNIKSGELEKVYDSVRSMTMILIIFTMISFIIAIMLTLNTLMMSVTEQKYEVGVLRAQGVFKSEIFKMFFYEATLLSFSGSLIGVFMGMGLSPLLKNVFFSSMMKDATFNLIISYNILSILGVFLMTFFISLLIGILPAYTATKIQIIEAIRNIKSEKKGKKFKKIIFPAVGIILTGIGYWILATSHRDIVRTLIGIIPFILGLIVVSTIFIPVLTKAFSYLFAFMLGPYRKVTDRNLKRDPKQTKITFIMFGLAIGFLVMVSNTLNSIEIVQYNAVPRFLGADIVISSEGSTFGMDEILISDTDIINNSVASATLINGMRVKVDDYGTWYSDVNDEPRITLYIIEGNKFNQTVNNISMTDTGGLSITQVFNKLDNVHNTTIVCHQLADSGHLNKKINDNLTIDLGGNLKFNLTMIATTDFISGFSETWEEPSDILPKETRGRYCLFVSWQTIIPLIDKYSHLISGLNWLPDVDIVVKWDDHDFDFWDFTPFNRTAFRNNFSQCIQGKEYEDQIEISERIWDENKTGKIADSIYEQGDLATHGMNIHIAFENTTLPGTTEFAYKMHPEFKTVSDAIKNGTDYCVITADINQSLGVGIGDNVSFWYYNGTSGTRKNFTISGIIEMNRTIEAINFNSQNPYVAGEYDVGADDSTVIIVDIATNASGDTQTLVDDFFHSYNNNSCYEFWIKFKNSTVYFEHHLKAIRDFQDYFGNDYVFADIRWIFTQEFAYAPTWLIQVAPGYDEATTLEKIKEFLLLNKMPVISWNTVSLLRDQYSDEIEFQRGFFNIVLSFALIIAVLGIMINMLIAISNRKREIGMMRAIGTYKKELLKMILGETLILVFSGFLIGTIMGTLSANQLLQGLPLDTVFDLKLFIDWTMIGFLFLIVFIVSIIASAMPIQKVLKLDVIEAVRAV